MKYMRSLFVVLLPFLLCAHLGVGVSAMNTGFSTELLTDEQKNTFLSNTNVTLLATEPTRTAIECFDVNENGMIAIGQKNSDQATVCIYSNDCIFQYGYTFTCSGDFGLEWDESDINIYFVRSEVIIAVNSAGEVLDILKVPDTIENNSYQNAHVYSSERTVGENEYVLRNDMGLLNVFASSYSQLVEITPAGEERIIYDVNHTQFANTLGICIGVVLFIVLIVIVIVWQFIKLRKKK